MCQNYTQQCQNHLIYMLWFRLRWYLVSKQPSQCGEPETKYSLRRLKFLPQIDGSSYHWLSWKPFCISRNSSQEASEFLPIVLYHDSVSAKSITLAYEETLPWLVINRVQRFPNPCSCASVRQRCFDELLKWWKKRNVEIIELRKRNMENLKIGQKEIMVKPEVPPRRNANPHKGHQSSNLNKSGEILTHRIWFGKWE